MFEQKVNKEKTMVLFNETRLIPFVQLSVDKCLPCYPNLCFLNLCQVLQFMWQTLALPLLYKTLKHFNYMVKIGFNVLLKNPKYNTIPSSVTFVTI